MPPLYYLGLMQAAHHSKPRLPRLSDTHFAELTQFMLKMNSATARVKDIKDGEKLMGFEDNWLTYSALYDELVTLRPWLESVLP